MEISSQVTTVNKLTCSYAASYMHFALSVANTYFKAFWNWMPVTIILFLSCLCHPKSMPWESERYI